MFQKVFVLILFSLLLPFLVFSQQKKLDQLLSQWKKLSVSAQQKSDTTTINLLNTIANEYMQTVSDSAFIFSEKALALSKSLKYDKGSSVAYVNIGKMHYMKGNYDLSLNYILTSLNISNKSNDKAGV
eukprot:Opistho-1_new@9924